MALSTVTAPELTAEQVQKILVQPLEDQSVILSSGVRIIDTPGSPVRLPKMGGLVDDEGDPATPSWHGQNELIDELDAEFDEIVLLPDSIKSVKTLTRFSNELARQSIISLDAALKARLVKDVADVLDRQFISGTANTVGGQQTTPVGLLNMSGTSELDGVGTLSLDDLHDAEGVALAANVDPTRLRWLIRSETFVGLRKLKDSQGRYLIQPDPTEAGAYRLLGHTVTVSNRLPKTAAVGETPGTTSALLWDPSQVAVARDQAPSVKVLDQTFGAYDQQALRVTARYDIGALNPEAVVVLSGITA